MRRIALIAIAVVVTATLTTSGQWVSGQSGTGGTLPEPTAIPNTPVPITPTPTVIVFPPTPTPDPRPDEIISTLSLILQRLDGVDEAQERVRTRLIENTTDTGLLAEDVENLRLWISALNALTASEFAVLTEIVVAQDAGTRSELMLFFENWRLSSEPTMDEILERLRATPVPGTSGGGWNGPCNGCQVTQ